MQSIPIHWIARNGHWIMIRPDDHTLEIGVGRNLQQAILDFRNNNSKNNGLIVRYHPKVDKIDVGTEGGYDSCHSPSYCHWIVPGTVDPNVH